MGIVLQGATIVTSESVERSDLRIVGETIAEIGLDLVQPGDQLIPADGCYLFPGGVDPHTHFDLDVGGTVTADDFFSGSRAALAGGTTTVIDYATQSRGGSLVDALAVWRVKAAGKSFVDYGFHVALCECNEAVLEELSGLPETDGVVSVKLYMAYKNVLQVDDGILLQVMRTCRERGILVCLHCENGDLIETLTGEAIAAGRFGPDQHAAARPEVVEVEAVFRALAIVELTGCPVYVVHVSSARALSIIEAAQRRGLPVWAETCPQYLLLDESLYRLAGFESAKYVMSPPLRTRYDQEGLWRGIGEGVVCSLGSDHCSFNFRGQKELGREDFSRIPNGIPGVENRFGLLFSSGVAAGRISLQKFVSLVSTGPARRFGLYPGKGALQVGSDADVVVWDPAGRSVISVRSQTQRVDYNAYEGFEQIGVPRQVFLRGRLAAEAGKICGGPHGKYQQGHVR